MIPLEKMTDEEFERHALSLLRRELGLDGPSHASEVTPAA